MNEKDKKKALDLIRTFEGMNDIKIIKDKKGNKHEWKKRKWISRKNIRW